MKPDTVGSLTRTKYPPEPMTAKQIATLFANRKSWHVGSAKELGKIDRRYSCVMESSPFRRVLLQQCDDRLAERRKRFENFWPKL